MPDWGRNPYRTDIAARDKLFLGRVALIEALEASVHEGRNAVHAIMGGRGMGKTSLAENLRQRLSPSVSVVLTRGPVGKVVSDLQSQLGVSLHGMDPAGILSTAVRATASGKMVLLIDEIERIMDDPTGEGFLDNLRDAYERTEGHLTIIVLGGTAVRDLLLSNHSPFLRIAGPIKTLIGLSLEETGVLMRHPLDLDLPDELVESVWTETAGHPWLIQMFMERAVQRATSPVEVAGQLPAAIREACARLYNTAFPIWWENLRQRGQAVYRLLVRAPGVVRRTDWVSVFGNDPRPWLDVLTSTGLAARDEQSIVLRGRLFAEWVQENWPSEPAKVETGDLDQWLSSVSADEFERLVIRSLAVWARNTVEFSAAAIRPDGGSGNAGLQQEAFFQMYALVALLQHEGRLTAEPEALSMRRRGRSDIKVRSSNNHQRRACIEVKIFGRDDETAVHQVISYSSPYDDFAAVISVDRCKRALQPVYEQRCFASAPPSETHKPPNQVFHPAFMTVHEREGLGSIRVWHFLVQLRDE
jgi:hypothetical protein